MQRRLPRIVVLDGGLGGTLAAYEIADAVRGRAELTLIVPVTATERLKSIRSIP